jgi:hypothetical protein
VISIPAVSASSFLNMTGNPPIPHKFQPSVPEWLPAASKYFTFGDGFTERLAAPSATARLAGREIRFPGPI